jgi:hypothetical protein
MDICPAPAKLAVESRPFAGGVARGHSGHRPAGRRVGAAGVEGAG